MTSGRQNLVSIQRWIYLFFLPLIIAGLTGCSSASTVPTQQKVRADFSVPIKDPLMKELAAATKRIDIKASGEFNPGFFTINGTPVTIPKGTTFDFEFSLPIENDSVVSTAHATGRLQTNLPLQIYGVPAPQLVVLKDGQATAELDVLRAFSGFFCNILQEQFGSGRTDNFRKMISTVTISSAILEFKPDSTLHFEQHSFHLDKGSKLVMSNLKLDSNLDYVGECLLQLNLASGSRYTGKKVDCEFQGGSAKVMFDAKRLAGLLSLVARPNQPVVLKENLYSFGADKSSTMKSSESDITIKSMDWSKREDAPKAFMHMLASAQLQQAHLVYNGKKFGLDANFRKPVPVDVEIIKEIDGDSIQFTTEKGVIADGADLNINRKTTKIAMALRNVRLGPISLSKAGKFDFSLAQGTSGLQSFTWSNEKKGFSIKPSGLSQISITPGMSLVLSKENGATSGTLPLNIKFGSAVLKSQSGFMNLKNVRGNILVKIQQEVELSSNLDFAIAETSFLGNHTANVVARGLSLTSKNGQSIADLNDCSIVFPQAELQSEVKEHLPDEKTFNLQIKVLPKQRWRYRNLVITKAVVTHPVVESIKCVKDNQFSFSTHADLAVEGTVEKAGIAAVLLKEAKFEEKPWSAEAGMRGTGTLTYKVIPGASLSKSKISYQLSMNMPLPDDVDLDWSEVSEGIVRKTEESIISAILKKIKPFKGTRIMPLDYSGEMDMFTDKKRAMLKVISVDQITTKPAPNGVQINFAAHARL